MTFFSNPQQGWVDRDVWWVCFNWWACEGLMSLRCEKVTFPPHIWGPTSPSGQFRMVSCTILSQGSLNLLYCTSRCPATQRKDKCGYAHFNEEGAKRWKTPTAQQSKVPRRIDNSKRSEWEMQLSKFSQILHMYCSEESSCVSMALLGQV